MGTIRNPKLVFPLFRHPLVSNLLSPRGYNVLEVRRMWVTKGSKTDMRFQRMDIDARSIKYSRLSLPYLFSHQLSGKIWFSVCHIINPTFCRTHGNSIFLKTTEYGFTSFKHQYFKNITLNFYFKLNHIKKCPYSIWL